MSMTCERCGAHLALLGRGHRCQPAIPLAAGASPNKGASKRARKKNPAYLLLGCEFSGVDTCEGISDQDIGVALLEEPILGFAAKRLSEMYGRIVARPDLQARIGSSARLRSVRSTAEELHHQLLLARYAAVGSLRAAAPRAKASAVSGPTMIHCTVVNAVSIRR